MLVALILAAALHITPCDTLVASDFHGMRCCCGCTLTLFTQRGNKRDTLRVWKIEDGIRFTFLADSLGKRYPARTRKPTMGAHK